MITRRGLFGLLAVSPTAAAAAANRGTGIAFSAAATPTEKLEIAINNRMDELIRSFEKVRDQKRGFTS